ncbi:hypothetical protein lbkm_0298 [Lachnospiraceae bacterium KM106-2]|nr:hypothetical protein lbkm_0298 [Lachnospiraceae bacterium KM106-2]
MVKDIKSQASAEKKAQDFIKRIQHINNKQEVRYLSCSIGICISNHRINTYEQMVASADRVLYNAKGGGKGRVYCCQVE